MRRRGLFVTGTDTGVGKTWVTSKLAAHWSRPGVVHPEARPGVVHPVAALKAAESGCQRGDAGLIASDDEALFRAAGGWQAERCRYRFEAAVAPGVAAEDLGMPIDFGVIDAQVEALAGVAEIVLVEGAGGWLVPMGGQRTIQDLAVVLGLPVLVVARAGLGTINHSLLTVQAIRAARLEPVAVAISVRADDDRGLTKRNRREIQQLGGVPTVIVESEASELAEVLGSRLGLD